MCFSLLCNLFCFLVGAYPAEYQYRRPVYLTTRSGLYDRSAHTPPLPPSEPAVTCHILIVFCFVWLSTRLVLAFLPNRRLLRSRAYKMSWPPQPRPSTPRTSKYDHRSHLRKRLSHIFFCFRLRYLVLAVAQRTCLLGFVLSVFVSRLSLGRSAQALHCS